MRIRTRAGRYIAQNETHKRVIARSPDTADQAGSHDARNGAAAPSPRRSQPCGLIQKPESDETLLVSWLQNSNPTRGHAAARAYAKMIFRFAGSYFVRLPVSYDITAIRTATACWKPASMDACGVSPLRMHC